VILKLVKMKLRRRKIMYCQKCGTDMSGFTVCPVCGNEQRIYGQERQAEGRGIKIVRKAAEFGGSIIAGTIEEVLDASIRTAGARAQKKVNKSTIKATHKVLVKMNLEKKTLGDRVHDMKKKRKKKRKK